MCDTCVAAVSIFCKDINIYAMTYSFMCVMCVAAVSIFCKDNNIYGMACSCIGLMYVWLQRVYQEKIQHLWHDSFIHVLVIRVVAVRAYLANMTTLMA